MPFHSPGDLLDPGIEPKSLALAGEFFTAGPPGKPIEGVLPFQGLDWAPFILSLMHSILTAAL